MLNYYHTEAYCPLGQYNSPLLKDETILAVAEKIRCSPAQVLLSWAVQRGTAVVPKSSNPQRMKDNLSVWRFASLLYYFF
jgi:glycerol 2-dehydrogenase (NADP+)